MFKKFKITCDEVTAICDKAQYGEASFYEKLQLNWHLLACKICALYSKQNSKMSDIFKMKASNCKNETKCLSKKDKDALKEQLSQFN
ncbi:MULTISPECIES: hypothetical protein [Tenacibaculum]|uniref:hypothetical protein n=1 Tax=Tenacibaculum TaxID=104267 RepID=UPI0021AF2DB3|nr:MULTISPECIES: hypothetical protein [Tenacibaculum]MCT4697719.1 hypothetical protein [Tenacibaculum haliotis]WBX71486.1 hypothetical protein PG912_01430 [Tenacibaculum retecalamus]